MNATAIKGAQTLLLATMGATIHDIRAADDAYFASMLPVIDPNGSNWSDVARARRNRGVYGMLPGGRIDCLPPA